MDGFSLCLGLVLLALGGGAFFGTGLRWQPKPGLVACLGGLSLCFLGVAVAGTAVYMAMEPLGPIGVVVLAGTATSAAVLCATE